MKSKSKSNDNNIISSSNTLKDRPEEIDPGDRKYCLNGRLKHLSPDNKETKSTFGPIPPPLSKKTDISSSSDSSSSSNTSSSDDEYDENVKV